MHHTNATPHEHACTNTTSYQEGHRDWEGRAEPSMQKTAHNRGNTMTTQGLKP